LERCWWRPHRGDCGARHEARRWFRDLSSDSAGEGTAYLDTNQKFGGRNALRDIPARDVAVLHYLKSPDAVGRFGREASGGAITVTRR
jgi:hypothetical protein